MGSILELIQQFWMELQQGQLPELGAWNYLLLAILTFWQGPTATLLGGAAASAGLLKPGLVLLVAILTNLSADVLWYTLGRTGNFERLIKRGPLKVHRQHYESLRVGMETHAPKIILMAKLSLGLVIPSLMAAGMLRISWRKWFPFVFIGETIWTGTIFLLGFFFTEAIKQIQEGIQLALALITFVVLALLLWFIPRYLRERDTMGLSSIDDNKPS